MNFSYENQGHNTFLVYSLAEGESIDTLSIGMLNNNNIPGFLDPMFIQMDLDRFVKYNVSAKISADQVFMSAVNRKKLISVFLSVVDGLLTAEEYMIDTSTVLLDLKYIFVDISTSQTSLIVLPVVGSDYKQPPVDMFFKQIMFSTQFDQTENCDYVAVIINHLNSATAFSLESFKSLLESLKKEGTPFAGAAMKPQPQMQVQAPVQPAKPTLQKSAAPAPKPAAPQPPVIQTPPVVNIPQPVQDKKAEISAVIKNNLTSTGESSEETKPISLFYLLQHFSSENLELYKRQKNESKSKKEESSNEPVGDLGFAIPGQKASPDDIKLPQMPMQPETPKSSPLQSFVRKGTILEKKPAAEPAPPIPMVPVQSVQPSVPFSDKADFGETCYYDDSDTADTTIMLGMEADERRLSPRLIRKKGDITIPVDKEIFRIGRNRDFNDYVVSDNKFIGHSHCHIVTRNGEYFAVDDNSKNHTYLDGEMMTPGQEYKLAHGKVLKLANEEFEFDLF